MRGAKAAWEPAVSAWRQNLFTVILITWRKENMPRWEKFFWPRPRKEEDKDNVPGWGVMTAFVLGLFQLMWRWCSADVSTKRAEEQGSREAVAVGSLQHEKGRLSCNTVLFFQMAKIKYWGNKRRPNGSSLTSTDVNIEGSQPIPLPLVEL